MINFIWVLLILLGSWYIFILLKDIIKHKAVLEKVNLVKTSIIGFVVNFFDVLGIGAFAPQTALPDNSRHTECVQYHPRYHPGIDLYTDH